MVRKTPFLCLFRPLSKIAMIKHGMVNAQRKEGEGCLCYCFCPVVEEIECIVAWSTLLTGGLSLRD